MKLSLCFIFHLPDFHNLKIINNIFFFIFEGSLIIFVQGCIYLYIHIEYIKSQKLTTKVLPIRS